MNLPQTDPLPDFQVVPRQRGEGCASGRQALAVDACRLRRISPEAERARQCVRQAALRQKSSGPLENPGREIINAPEFVGSTWEKEDLITSRKPRTAQPPRGNDAPARRAGSQQSGDPFEIGRQKTEGPGPDRRERWRAAAYGYRTGALRRPSKKPRRRPVPLIGRSYFAPGQIHERSARLTPSGARQDRRPAPEPPLDGAPTGSRRSSRRREPSLFQNRPLEERVTFTPPTSSPDRHRKPGRRDGRVATLPAGPVKSCRR